MRSNGLLRDVLGLDDRRKNKIRGINLSDQRYTPNPAVRSFKFTLYQPYYPNDANLSPLLCYVAAETVPGAFEEAARVI
jgi:hypothetical protein